MNATGPANAHPNGSANAKPAGALDGKRIAVLAADGVEQPELETAAAALKAAGAAVVTVAPRAGRIRGMRLQQPSDLVRVDCKLDDARAADFDGLLVPGGYIGPDQLRQSAPARALVCAFDALGKPIACMSHAALVLVSCGLARGRRLTGWPGVRDDLVNAGAIWLDRDVVRDGRYLTSRTPDDAAAFARALGPFFAGDAQAASAAEPTPDAGADAIVDAAAASDPAPAPELANGVAAQALRWLAAPSLGAMLSLALLGVGVVAVNSRRLGRASGESDRSTDAGAKRVSDADAPDEAA